MNKKTIYWLIGIALVVLISIGLYYVPPIHSRLSWRIDNLISEIRQALNPPEQVVFLPTQQIVETPTPRPTATHTRVPPTFTPGPTLVPTITPTPLPGSTALRVPVYVDQFNRWNYCGPANLTMALNFWGWQGDRDVVARAIKPGQSDPSMSFIDRGRADLNVMPYEMVDFVNDQTDYAALFRYGGEIELIKLLIANGFPVIIEKGYTEQDSAGVLSWMGHYAFTTGYDDERGVFIYQNSYPQGGASGKDNPVSYEDFIRGWRAFNYLFIVVYPIEREGELYTLLGPWADPRWAVENALRISLEETQTLESYDLYFAWFNRGTSHVNLQEYADGAVAYDFAFQIYAGLPEGSQRPYRMLWYQTGPYWAYYYSGRYLDVINLATLTLSTPRTGSTLEESLYWRALAEYAIGDTAAAFADMRAAVFNNPNFAAGLAIMQQWGITP